MGNRYGYLLGQEWHWNSLAIIIIANAASKIVLSSPPPSPGRIRQIEMFLRTYGMCCRGGGSGERGAFGTATRVGTAPVKIGCLLLLNTLFVVRVFQF